MPFPTTGILDNFNRANAAIYGSTASGGDTWGANALNDTGPGTLSIVSNAIAEGSGSPNGYLTGSHGPDAEAYMTAAALPGGGNYFFLAVRVQDAGVGSLAWDGYGLIYIVGTGWQIRRYDNGASTVLGATVSTPTVSAGDGLGIEAIGDTIKGYHKPAAGAWTEVLSRIDATYTAAGNIAVEIGSAPSGTGRGDDLGGGTVVTGPVAVGRARSRPLIRP